MTAMTGTGPYRVILQASANPFRNKKKEQGGWWWVKSCFTNPFFSSIGVGLGVRACEEYWELCRRIFEQRNLVEDGLQTVDLVILRSLISWGFLGTIKSGLFQRKFNGDPQNHLPSFFLYLFSIHIILSVSSQLFLRITCTHIKRQPFLLFLSTRRA